MRVAPAGRGRRGEARDEARLHPTPPCRVGVLHDAIRVSALAAPPGAAAEDGGLGAGGVAFALNYTLILGIVLAFIFGFGLRDYIHKRMLRAKAKKPTSSPPRT